jgi:hypothetical protein
MADPSYIVNGVLTDGEAWVGIAHDSLSLPAATVTWTSTDDGQTGDFSQYLDLVIVSYVRTDRATVTTDYLEIALSGATSGSNYSNQYLSGDGSSATAAADATSSRIMAEVPCAGAGANIFGAYVSHLFDINSGKFKTMLHQSALDLDGSGVAALYALTLNSHANATAAVSSVLIQPRHGSNLVAGSMFSLFGVLPRMVT